MADRERLARLIALQGEACARLGSPLYAGLLAAAAEDARAGGPVARVLAGREDAPGPDAVALRLMGGVHRLVLEGRAPELAAFYPSVGGRAGSTSVRRSGPRSPSGWTSSVGGPARPLRWPT